MTTPIPKSDVPIEKAEMNDEYGLSQNRTFVIPYLANPFKEFAKDDDFKIMVYLDIERLRTKVIPGRDPFRYPPYVSYMTPFERHRFTMKCIYCHQTSPISDASLRDKLNSIDMLQTLNARLINHFPYHRYPSVTCPKCKKVILFPHWMQLIDRVKYVPTLLEGALEIGRVSMLDDCKDWVDGPYYLDIDSMCSIADHEAEPGYWFISDRNRYLSELKI